MSADEKCEVQIDGVEQDVKKLTVLKIGQGRTFVEVTDLEQLQELLGGTGKKVTVDGKDAAGLTGTPTGTERVTVAPEKGGQGTL